MAARPLKLRKAKFQELSRKRVDRLIREIRVLGNLSNKNFYEFEKKQLEALFKELHDALKESQERFKF